MPQQELYKAMHDINADSIKKIKDLCADDSSETLKKLQKDLDDAHLKSTNKTKNS